MHQSPVLEKILVEDSLSEISLVVDHLKKHVDRAASKRESIHEAVPRLVKVGEEIVQLLRAYCIRELKVSGVTTQLIGKWFQLTPARVSQICTDPRLTESLKQFRVKFNSFLEEAKALIPSDLSTE